MLSRVFQKSRVVACCVIVGSLAMTQPACAILIDWDTLPWETGVWSQSFDIDPAHPGNDIQVWLLNGTSAQVDSAKTGGYLPVKASLQLTGAGKFIVNFLYNDSDGVRNVNFKVFDVDASGSTYEDRVRIDANEWTHMVIHQVRPGARLTASAANSVINDFTDLSTPYTYPPLAFGTAPAADSSGDGNVTAAFGNAVINRLIIDYAINGTDPSMSDGLSIADISFDPVGYAPVPEAGTTIAGGTVSALALWLFRKKRISTPHPSA